MPRTSKTSKGALYLTWLARGLVKHCPLCGAGRLFRGWLTMVERCPGCNHRFEREEGFFLGAIVMNVVLIEGSLLAFMAASIVATLPDPPIPLLATLGVGLMVLVPIAFYPFSKTIWSGVYLIMEPLTDDERAELRGPRAEAAMAAL